MEKMAGDNCILRAKERLNRYSIFDLFTSKKTINDEVIKLYVEANSHYRMSDQWDLAGNALLEAAILAQKNEDLIEATFLEEAALCYIRMPIKKDYDKIVKSCILKAIKLFDQQKDFNKVGQLYELLGDHADDIEYYDLAIGYYTPSCYKKICMDKLANGYALKGLYDVAKNVFNQILECKIGEVQDKHIFKLSLCVLQLDGVRGLEHCVGELGCKYPRFLESNEGSLLCAICDAIESNNINKFNSKIKKHTESNVLCDWENKVLEEAKKSFKFNTKKINKRWSQ